MKMISKYIYLMQHILTIQKVNGLLYYAKMIPFIGKCIPDTWYRSTSIKTIGSIIMLLLTLIISFALKFAYVLCMMMLPLTLLGKAEPQMSSYVLWIFLILSGLGGPLLTNTTTQPVKKEYIMISLMHMSAKRYTCAKWVWELGMNTIMLSIVFVFVTLNFSLPIWYVFIIMIYFVGMHLGGEALHMRYFSTHEKPLANNYTFLFGSFFVVYGLAYGMLFLPFDLSHFQNSIIIVMFLIGLLAILCALPFLKKVDYTAIMRKGLLNNRSIYDGTLKIESKKADIELKDKDYSEKELKQQAFSNKHGYDYLNALFFQRHKRLLYRPMRRRIIWLVGAFVVFDIALLYFGRDFIIGDWNQPFQLLPGLLFLMYFTSIGERVTRAMFYNCDSSLLHYGYYRQASAILQNFKIRLKKLMMLNGLLALLILLGYGSVLCLIWKDIFILWEHLLLMLCIISISLFFSIHHLFLYYILQPYTGEMEMKSPMFGVINGIVYAACYFIARVEGTALLAYSILGVTVMYSIIAMVLVYRLAPKNFHIR